MLLSTAIVVRTVATPWLAALADNGGRRRGLLVVLAGLATLAFWPFAAVDGFVPLFALSVLFGVFYPPLIPLTDNLTVLAAREHGLRYGRIRLWGSAAFLVTAILVGDAVESRGPELVHTVILVALAASFLLAPFVPAPTRTTAPPARGARPIRTLLGDRRFIVVLAAAGIVQASHAAYYGFSTLHWKAEGIGEDVTGWLWAEGVIAEIVLFAFATGTADRLGPRRLFLIGAAAAALRWSALALTADVHLLFAVNWLHALSFGATHLGVITFLAHAVPARFSATAQSLVSAVTTGVAMAVATSLSGWLYGSLGGDLFWVMAAIAGLGGVLAARLGDVTPGAPGAASPPAAPSSAPGTRSGSAPRAGRSAPGARSPGSARTDP